MIIVATVLTVYGIETPSFVLNTTMNQRLQQYLPFTVLKLIKNDYYIQNLKVATVLTVYGIETILEKICIEGYTQSVATVLTVYGIET